MAVTTYTYNASKRAVVHVAGANSTIVIAGNNSVSNIATGTQNLTGATITKIWFGSAPSGYWNIKRGANLVYAATGSGFHYFDGAALSTDKTANVVCELMGVTNGFIMIELHKEGVLE